MTGIKTRNKIIHLFIFKKCIEHLLGARHSAGERSDIFPSLTEFMLNQAGERIDKQSITKYDKYYD